MGTTFHHHAATKPSHILIKKLVPCLLYIILPLALLYLYLSSSPSPPPNATRTAISSSSATAAAAITTATTTPSSPSHESADAELRQDPPSWPPCNYSDGRWVPHAGEPLYSGTGCKTIKEGQNCMAHGRPDTGYLRWRWQPHHCPLPPFDPIAFLRLIQHKHIAFVGDSMARNQLESLLCLLATAAEPELVYREGEENKFRRWVFRGWNASVSVIWSPFLVKGVEKQEAAGINYNMLYLETANERWAAEVGAVDVVVFSFGHWYLHSAVYHENGAVLGCHACERYFNHTEIGFFDVFRKAVRTALGEVARRYGGGESEKLVVLTTFSPAHFEGEWDKAGACPRTEPYAAGEKEMQYMDALMRRIEVEEVASAVASSDRGRVSFEALDVTEMAMLRADAHPGPYMHPSSYLAGNGGIRVQNDCVHWCLPGAIDAWNEILAQVVRRWRQKMMMN